jgi:GxxExxY protein
MIEDELTYHIIGCAMKVHKTMGNGFQEVIYQRCLAIEQLRFEQHGSQAPLPQTLILQILKS